MSKNAKSGTLLFIAYSAFVTIGLPVGILNVAWELAIQDAFQRPFDAIGVLLAIGTIGFLLSSFGSGRAISRIGIGSFLLGGILIGGVGLIGYGLSPSWELLLVAAFLAGLGGGTLDAGLNTFVAANYSTSRMNWLHAAFGIGTTVGPLLFTVIVVKLGQSWRWSYGLVGLIQIALGVCILLTLKYWRMPTQIDSDPGAEPTAGNASILDTLKLMPVWIGIGLFFVYGGAEVGAGQLTTSLFTDARGIDQETASNWISIYWLSFTIGRLLFGFIVDRIKNTVLLRGSMLMAVAGAGLLWWNPSDIFSFIGLAIMGFAFAPLFPALISETPARVGIRHTANSIGFQVGATSLGIAILPWIAAIVATSAGLEIIGPFLVATSFGAYLLYELMLSRSVQQLSPQKMRS